MVSRSGVGRNLPIRLVATGGDAFKADLTGIGREGRAALDGIENSASGASRGLTSVSGAAGGTLATMEALAARAGQAAATLRQAGNASSEVMARIDHATGVSSASGQSTRAILEQGKALDDLRARYNPMFATVRAYRQELADIRRAHMEGAISADEMAAAISRSRQSSLASIAAIKGRSTALRDMGDTSRYAAFQSRMLMFQLNDVFVSLASGMNPLMVFVQQGSQIGQIYGGGHGGVQAALRDTAKMALGVVTRFGPLAAVIGAGAAAVAGMRAEINATSDVAVSFGDTALAVWQFVRDGLVGFLRPAIDLIGGWFSSAWDAAVSATITAGNAIINSGRVAVLGIGTAVASIPDLFEAAFSLAVAKAISKLHDMVWWVGQAVNGIAETFNDTFGTSLSTDNLDGVVDALSDASGRLAQAGYDARGRQEERMGEFRRRASEIMGSDPLGDAFASIRDRAIANALDETAEAAGRAGGAMRKAGGEAAEGAEEAKSVWDSVRDALADYATEAMDLGKGLGDSIVSTFRSAEEAIGQFVKTGKLDVRDMVTSMLADMAQLSARRFILAPLANALGGLFGGPGGGLGGLGGLGGGAGSTLPLYEGGGNTGWGPRSGGLDGRGGFLAMMHPREEVIDYARGGRREPAPVYVTINARDANSFRQSRAQVAADIARAVSSGRRAM